MNKNQFAMRRCDKTKEERKQIQLIKKIVEDWN